MKAKFKIGMLVKSKDGGYGEVDAVVTRSTSFSYMVRDGENQSLIEEGAIECAYAPLRTRTTKTKTKTTTKKRAKPEAANELPI